MTNRWNQFRLGLNRLYLNDRLFIGIGCVAVLAVLAYAFPVLTFLPVLALALLLGALGYDTWQLFNGNLRLAAHRKLPKVLSLGDEMTVRIELGNLSSLPLKATVIDELPEQLQVRDLEIVTELAPRQRKSLSYPIRPTSRGAYQFGALNIYLETAIGLVQRRFIIDQAAELPVYPSIIQMKKYAQMALSVSVPAPGMRKLRRMGKSYEFDQIKQYVRGDDYRSINWRATGRRNELMVNQYEDERAQQIYCIIDKSRQMHMPFNGLTLLDYAINATLALSNIVIQKHDRAGLITYSDKIGTALRADGKTTQLQLILQALYRESAREGENNPELLYFASRKFISGRSLLLLFSNFESNYALERALPTLRKISTNHLLVVVLFENTEIRDGLEAPVANLSEIYYQSTARHFLYEKQMLAQRLRQYGIQVILTRPEELTANTIGKYLELKRRGMI